MLGGGLKAVDLINGLSDVFVHGSRARRYLGSEGHLLPAYILLTLIESPRQSSILLFNAIVIGHSTSVPVSLHVAHWLAGCLRGRLLCIANTHCSLQLSEGCLDTLTLSTSAQLQKRDRSVP